MVVIVVVAAVMVYAWSTGLLSSLLVQNPVPKETLNYDSFSYGPGSSTYNMTIYVRNSGSAAVVLQTYYAKDSNGNQYTSGTGTGGWNTTSIAPNAVVGIVICIKNASPLTGNCPAAFASYLPTDTILPLVDGLVDSLRKGIGVLDVGCGSGHAINLMAKAFPNSRFVGYDFSKKAIVAAKAEAKRLKLDNAQFAAKDVATLNEPKKYDLITAFDSIHDQAKPTRVLKAISKSLRPDGVFLLVDVAASSNLHENLQHPLGPFLYSISTMHCMTVSLAYRGEGLGTVWGEQLAKQKLSDAGFKSMEIRKVPGDILNSYYIARKT